MADKFGHIKRNRQDKVKDSTSHGSPIVTNAGGVDGFFIRKFDFHFSDSGQFRVTNKSKLNIDLFEREFLILAADFFVKEIARTCKINPQIAKRRILQSKKWIESNHSYGDCSNYPLYSELNFKINFGHVFMGYAVLRASTELHSTFSQQIKLNTV